MPDFSTSIDIDPYEYIDECSRSEIKELIEILIDNWISTLESCFDTLLFSKSTKIKANLSKIIT